MSAPEPGRRNSRVACSLWEPLPPPVYVSVFVLRYSAPHVISAVGLFRAAAKSPSAVPPHTQSSIEDLFAPSPSIYGALLPRLHASSTSRLRPLTLVSSSKKVHLLLNSVLRVCAALFKCGLVRICDAAAQHGRPLRRFPGLSPGHSGFFPSLRAELPAAGRSGPVRPRPVGQLSSLLGWYLFRWDSRLRILASPALPLASRTCFFFLARRTVGCNPHRRRHPGRSNRFLFPLLYTPPLFLWLDVARLPFDLKSLAMK